MNISMSPLDRSIALVMLAAGRGERFGCDKLASEFRGRQLWEWAALAAEEAGFQCLYAVIGEHSSVRPAGRVWQTVLNPNAQQGMGTSIAAGIAAAAAHERVVIALADMPLIHPSHLRELGQGSGTIFTRQTDGCAGSPAAFGREDFAKLRSLVGDQGARSLAFPDASIIEPEAGSMLADIDTSADLVLALSK